MENLRERQTQSTCDRKASAESYGLLRGIVITLSIVSLLSRIIYCSYTTWITFSALDCVRCPSNQTSNLFSSHHSLVKLGSVRGLNVNVLSNQTNNKVRRSIDEPNTTSDYFRLSSEDESLINDYYETKRKAEDLAKQSSLEKITLDWFDNLNGDEHKTRATTGKRLNDVHSNSQTINEKLVKPNKTDTNVSSVSSHSRIYTEYVTGDKQIVNNLNAKNSAITVENVTKGVDIKREFVDNSKYKPIMKDDGIQTQLFKSKKDAEISDTLANGNSVLMGDRLNDSRIEFQSLNESSNKANKEIVENLPENNDLAVKTYLKDNFTLKLVLNEPNIIDQIHEVLESGKNSTKTKSAKSLSGLLSDSNAFAGDLNTSSVESSPVKCSDDCGKFFTFKLNNTKDRKWVMILLTAILYLYVLVMLSIFLGACFACIDLLIIATFIEGAKLFACLVLLIIDNLNGGELYFNLIDIKINVNSKGNGWTAEFYYSEYLLDIIIFLLASLLSIKMFKMHSHYNRSQNSGRRNIEISETSGTYRERHSRNTSRHLPQSLRPRDRCEI